MSVAVANTMSTDRISHTSTLLQDGTVLVVGGFNSTGNRLATADRFNPFVSTSDTGLPAARSFQGTGSMAAGRSDHSATLLPSGKVLVAGGLTGNGTSLLATAELYDPLAGTFSATGSMGTARYRQSATLLNDGTVLIAGGEDSGQFGIGTAEIYDPVAGTFSPTTGNLNTARYGHTATLLNDGTVLITGGLDGSTYISSAEIYNPVAKTFATVGPMSAARFGHTATLLKNGTVLVAGGTNSSNYLATAEIYDPGTQTFTTTGSMTVARAYYPAAALSDGRVLVIGGRNSLASNGLTSVEAYDPATGTFSAVGNLSTARQFHAASALVDGGRVLVTGGLGGPSLNTGELLTPFTPTSDLGPSGEARVDHSSTLLNDGRVLIAGGDSITAIFNDAFLYDPILGGIAPTAAPMTVAHAQHAATLLDNGKVLISGGYDNTGVGTAASELYDPATRTFSATGSMNSPRFLHSATVLDDGTVLIVGGLDASNAALASAEIYHPDPADPAFGTFTALTGTLNTARFGHTATKLDDGRVLIAGGSDSIPLTPISSAEIYDPFSQSFSFTNSMNVVRVNHTATLLNDGTVLITGGTFGTGAPLDTAEYYDPFGGLFNLTSGTMTSPRASHTATLLNNGHVLLAGGASSSTSITDSADDYDPATQTFTPAGALLNQRDYQTATLLIDGRTLITAGLYYVFGTGCVSFCPPTSTYLVSSELFIPASVTPANLVSIALSPSSATAAVGAAQPFVAVGTYSDTHVEHLQSATWSSGSTGVATISNDAGNHGRAFALATGTSTITACAGTVCGSGTLNVLVATNSDIGVTIASPSLVLLGTNFDYTITVTNSGPEDATQVIVNDDLPSAMSFDAATGASCTTGPGDGFTVVSCTLAPLAAGTSAQIFITATPNFVGGPFTSFVSVSNFGTDPNSGNNSASDAGVTVVPNADLALAMSANPAVVAPGGTATYTATFGNFGPSDATGVTVTNTFPAGVTVTSVTPSVGTCGTPTTTISCSIGTLLAGGIATIDFVVQIISPGVFTDSATIAGIEADIDGTNNSDFATVSSVSADLAVTAGSTTIGGVPVSTVTVTNNGPSDATGVVLTDALDRYVFVSASPSGFCSAVNSLVTCNIGSLANGASVTFNIFVTAPTQGWAAHVYHAYSDQLDPTPANNSSRVGPSLNSFNTPVGANVVVAASDSSGDSVTVTYAGVSRVGATTITAAPAAVPPPAGFRFGNPAVVYDISSNADYTAPITVTLGFNLAAFRHPAKVRLFHMEGGVWIDRTSAVNLAAATVSAVTSSLSPFIVVEPLNSVPVANAGSAQVVPGAGVAGAGVRLDASASSDADADALTYRWTGPFPEGNGVAGGVAPTVTLPLGTSTVSLVVNDGESASAATTVNITVSDFTIAAASSASLRRGQSVGVSIAVSPKFGPFGAPVALSCPDLPAGLACSFSSASVTPGAGGGAASLTITASPTALLTSRRSPPLLALWLATLAPFGLVWSTRLKRRRTALLLALMLVLLVAFVACGGGGGGFNASPNPPSGSSATTLNISVTGTSGGLQHSTVIPVTLQ